MTQQTLDRVWLAQPAQEWVNAFPIGNGALGVMVHGGVAHEQLQLNEETVWAGGARDTLNPAAYENVPRVRQLLFEGKPKEALDLAEKTLSSIPLGVQPYQTLGDLWLDFEGHEYFDEYRRELDIENAVAHVSYRCGDSWFKREAFVSAKGGVFAMKLSAEGARTLTLTLHLTRVERAVSETCDMNSLRLRGSCPGVDGRDGVAFEALLHVMAEGGEVSERDGRIRVEGARSVTLMLAAATDFRGGNPREICRERIAAAMSKGYDKLRDEHIADYRKLFSRVTIELGETPQEVRLLPIDERLQRLKKGEQDAALGALYFQFARYLLISSSRPGNLPANLQGIWNFSIAPPWNCDFHTNINLQMNYWPAEPLNLSECHEPLFDLVERLCPSGRETARRMYGCRGSVMHHLTDVWGFTTVADGARWGLWPSGLAWLSAHMWQHFLFDGDREFLSKRAYPVLRDCALFYLDYLVEDKDGYLVAGPSMSPENNYYLPDGTIGFICMGATGDTQIAREVFTNAMAASEILQCDEDLRRAWMGAREKLQPHRIGRHGQLMEWSEDYDEVEPGHRHIMHLYGLHPGNQITPRGTPDLAQAARKTLERRMAYGASYIEGAGRIGWSCAWAISFYARLHDGESAGDYLNKLLADSTRISLLDWCPPFQIDGNFGGGAGVAEMLLQSHESTPFHAVLHLIPALPKMWDCGRVNGLRACGGLEVDLEWSAGALVCAKLRATRALPCTVFIGRETRGSHVVCDDEEICARQQEDVLNFETKAGREYLIKSA